MRYVFTQYLFGGEVFPPALMDARLDPMLRALGLTPSPARAERSWVTPRPRFVPATAARGAYYALTVPAGVWPVPSLAACQAICDASGREAGGSAAEVARCRAECADAGNIFELPNDTDASEVTTITKVTKVFEGEVLPMPWPAFVCTASGFSRPCARADGALMSSLISTVLGLLNGPSGDLASRYGFFATGAPGRAAVVAAAPSSGYGGLFAVLAVVGGYAYYATRSSPLRGLGRVPVATKTNRLRKLAQRRRHEGRFMEARRLEQRANRLSRSS